MLEKNWGIFTLFPDVYYILKNTSCFLNFFFYISINYLSVEQLKQKLIVSNLTCSGSVTHFQVVE